MSEQTTNPPAAKSKPVKTFRAGALSVSVWEKRNKSDGEVFYNEIGRAHV